MVTAPVGLDPILPTTYSCCCSDNVNMASYVARYCCQHEDVACNLMLFSGLAHAMNVLQLELHAARGLEIGREKGRGGEVLCCVKRNFRFSDMNAVLW